MKPKKFPGRSKGAIMLARCGATQTEIATAVGVAQSNVARFMSGERTPTQPAHLVALSNAYGIPPAAWKQPHAEPRPKRTKAPELAELAADVATVKTGGSKTTMVRAECERVMLSIRRVVALLESQEQTPPDYVRTLRAIFPVLTHLARITGEAQVVDEARIVRLPAWRAVEAALVEALTPWPEAALAAGKALEAMAEGR